MSADPCMPSGSSRPPRVRERFVIPSIGGLWALYLVLVALRTSMVMLPHRAALLERHGVTAAIGAVLCWGLHLVLQCLGHRSVRVRIGAGLLLAAVPAALLALVNYNVMFVFDPQALWSDSFRAEASLPVIVTQTLTENYFLFATWATLATAFDAAVREADAWGHAALLTATAREAELRALRYQLDPHFMFNALNTISALVIAGDADGAERTIDALSRFLSETLAINAAEDVPLDRELALQRLYLDVEQVRFGDRLGVELISSPSARNALVPALLLQPLIENVIRHAVTRIAGRRVTLTVRATREDDLLRLVVEDDAPTAAIVAVDQGGGVGLRNVGARLAIRFGDQARFRHGARAGGGFRVDIALPFRTAS